MVSSTFTDLEEHRAALISAINGEDLHEVAMENSSAKPIDVIESSIQMVRDGSAYIGVISHKYGQIPSCSRRNPQQLSLTELEFNEAQRLKRPILLFIMGDKHHVLPADVETDPTKREKLISFRERAKQMEPVSPVHRVYDTFNSVEAFSRKAIHAIASLRRYLDEKNVSTIHSPSTGTEPTKFTGDPIPLPPAFYAEPPYIGSHTFVGRQTQLDTLSEWATPADSHSILLFEAIGGTGKSILTWEWTTKFSSSVREDWAGRFWYSFYEKGSTMLDFCRRALVYMTRQPRSNFKERNTAELAELLIHQLQAQPWLIILDGLERILVSYHRFDAAQVRDEDAGTTDTIAHRNPCAAINPEDEDLLRALAGASPSKLLLTTRLIPRVLLNKSNQLIPGVLREYLPGLRPLDAEALILSCGVTGTSIKIQSYLKSHCDCHPLVIGVLAGLVNDYLPDRGNFDAWAEDSVGGGQLNLAHLDLVQKRNHILNAALTALPEASRHLLSTLALLSEPVDYPTLSALNPALSPSPEEVPRPKKPKNKGNRSKISEAAQTEADEDYRDAIRHWEEFNLAPAKREKEMRMAAPGLEATVKDLERRGLLQYDPVTKRHDIHPVVRGIASGGLKSEEKRRYGQCVVDHFSLQALDPYNQAESPKDFDNASHIVKALFHMGKLEKARDFVLRGTFIETLNHRFEAHNDILTIIRPFFSSGWHEMPTYLEKKGGIPLAKRASVALRRIGALQDAFDISQTALQVILKKKIIYSPCSQLLNLASTVGDQNYLAQEDRLLCLAKDSVIAFENANDLTTFELARFRQLSKLGRWTDALALWDNLSDSEIPLGTRSIAAHHYAVHLYLRGELTEQALASAEKLNRSGKSALGHRNLCALRGYWELELNNFMAAKKYLQDAVALAHKAGKIDRRSEICLAIAKYNLKELHEPSQVAEQFAYEVGETCNLVLANFYFAIDDQRQAEKFAFAAYKWACGDGEPYVRRWELNKARSLLEKLNVEIPEIPPYDPAKDNKSPWENDVAAAIKRFSKISNN